MVNRDGGSEDEETARDAPIGARSVAGHEDGVNVTDKGGWSGKARPWLPVLGLGVAVWAMVPPYLGPGVSVRPGVEVVDHVLPGIVVLATSAVVMTFKRLAGRALPPNAMLAAGFVVLLAGFWMTATHLPLAQELARDEVMFAPVAHHSLPGLAVLLVGLLWVVAYWAETGPPTPTGANATSS